MKRFVIYSSELGVFMAPMDGVNGFTTVWTQAEDSDEVAATFATPEQADDEVASWPGPPPADWRAVEVEADGAGRATLAACVVAGIPAVGEGVEMVGYTPGGAGERRPGWSAEATVLEGGGE